MKKQKTQRKKIIPEGTITYRNEPNFTQMAKMIINIYNSNQQDNKNKKS